MIEVLDHINPRYTIDDKGTITDIKTNSIVPVIQAGTYLTVDLYDINGKLKTYKPAELCAECFVPNYKNERHIAYKDGNPLNIYYKNLAWCSSRKNYAPTNLTPEERQALRIEINNAIDAGLWSLAQELGEKLDNMEDLRTRNMPSEYKPLTFDSKIPVQFSVILEATDLLGNHLAYGTANELAQVFDVKLTTLRKRYSKGASADDTIKFNIIALVPKNMANSIVEVYNGDTLINSGSYTRICLEYNIHFEDLSDLLYTNEGDKITFNGLEFKMAAGQKKIPVDFTKGAN